MSDNGERQASRSGLPRRLVLRIPRTSLLAVLAMMAFAIPFASGWPPLWIVYIVPLAAGYAVLRWRTLVDTEGMHARGLVHSRRIGWGELRSLRLAERAWVRAVLADGDEVVLPTVRLRHVPALSLMSGGIVADPTEPKNGSGAGDAETGDTATGDAEREDGQHVAADGDTTGAATEEAEPGEGSGH